MKSSTPANREPIPVSLIRFDGPIGQDAPGLSQASACRSTTNGGRHELLYLPWMRAFRIVFIDPERQRQAGYIPEHRVAYWEADETPQK
jgi:hypothetical protein